MNNSASCTVTGIPEQKKEDDEVVWSTGTARKSRKIKFHSEPVLPHHEVRLRRDGVLVVVDTDTSKTIWKSSRRKQTHGNYIARLDAFGSLVVELGTEVIWTQPPVPKTK